MKTIIVNLLLLLAIRPNFTHADTLQFAWSGPDPFTFIVPSSPAGEALDGAEFTMSDQTSCMIAGRESQCVVEFSPDDEIPGGLFIGDLNTGLTGLRISGPKLYLGRVDPGNTSTVGIATGNYTIDMYEAIRTDLYREAYVPGVLTVTDLSMAPEPTPFILLGTGLVGLAVILRLTFKFNQEKNR